MSNDQTGTYDAPIRTVFHRSKYLKPWSLCAHFSNWAKASSGETLNVKASSLKELPFRLEKDRRRCKQNIFGRVRPGKIKFDRLQNTCVLVAIRDIGLITGRRPCWRVFDDMERIELKELCHRSVIVLAVMVNTTVRKLLFCFGCIL